MHLEGCVPQQTIEQGEYDDPHAICRYMSGGMISEDPTFKWVRHLNIQLPVWRLTIWSYIMKFYTVDTVTINQPGRTGV